MAEVETEVKYGVDSRPSLLDSLDERDSYVQTDFYLSPPSEDFSMDKVDYLRLRKYGDGSCSFDRHIVRDHEDTLEFEVDVEDASKMLELLKSLDFEVYVKVEKDRTIYEAGNFDVVYDEIKGLGSFVEVEARSDFKRSELEDLVEKLGLEEERKVEGKCYPDLLLESR